MEILEKFKPDYFNNLSLSEKQKTVKELGYFIMDKLRLKHIPITFYLYENEPVSYLGKLIRHPTFIYIHEILLTGTSDNYSKSKDMLDNDIFRTYLLVFSVAHECYHYYQLNLIKKLVHEPETLTQKEKEDAYKFFVSSFSKIFSTLNEKYHFSSPPCISEKDLYLFSYSEYSANKFASGYTYLLGTHYDDQKNLDLFRSKHIIPEDTTRRLIEKIYGEKMFAKVSEHNLKLAVDYLKYKKTYNNLKDDYLGINIDDLENCLNELIKEQKEDLDPTTKLLNALFKNK